MKAQKNRKDTEKKGTEIGEIETEKNKERETGIREK